MAFVFGAGGRGTSGFLFRSFLIISSRLPGVAACAAGATRLTTVTVMMVMVAVTRTAGSFTAQTGSTSAQAIALPGRARSRVAATAAAGMMVMMPGCYGCSTVVNGCSSLFVVVLGAGDVLRVGKRARGQGGALQSRPCVLADRYLLVMVMRCTGSISHLSISCVFGTTLGSR